MGFLCTFAPRMNRDAIDFQNAPVSRLFRKLLLPTLLGTLSIAAVTAIDGIFIGHGVGADGVAAVNIAVPIYQIMSGIGLMVGVGCSVAASIHLSQGKAKVARYNVTQAIVSTSILAAVACALVWCFPKQTALLLGSSQTLLPQVKDYLVWIMPSFIFEMWSLIGLFIIRLDGSPRYAMWCNVINSILNAVLDWVFIFPLDMGVKGAAIATAISISAGGVMALAYLLFSKGKLNLIPLKASTKSLMLALRNVGYHCRIGSSTLLGELTLAVFFFIGNQVFMHYLGDNGVGAFGIACYYAPFFFMVGNSIAQSAQPIISYNYGISRWGHIAQARRLLLGTSALFGVAVSLLFIFIPDSLVALFIAPSTPAARIAIEGFPYFAAGIIFFILNVAIIGYYQSIEQVKRATVMVFLRGLVFLLPSFIMLPKLLGIPGIWLAMPLAEALTLAVITYILLAKK